MIFFVIEILSFHTSWNIILSTSTFVFVFPSVMTQITENAKLVSRPKIQVKK